MHIPSNPMVLVGPTILLVFMVFFILVWLLEKQRQYLLFFIAANFLFCTASLSQILYIPHSDGANAVISAFFYTLSLLLLCDGLLRRSEQKLSAFYYISALSFIVGGISYFYYLYEQLIIRIYILNFGIGIIFVLTAWRLRHLSRGKLAEKVFFWIFLIFALHFFPRTIFTVGDVPEGLTEFNQSTFWLTLQFSLAILGVALALSLLAMAVSDMLESLGREGQFDLLTGVLNRRGFEEKSKTIFAEQASWPVQIMAIDIDYFKVINDTFGHATGDLVLENIGRILTRNLRPGDICGRLGGEEFAVILRNCEPAQAYFIADHLRLAIAREPFAILPEGRHVTISIGLASAQRHEGVMSVINRADIALYRAKNAGRNQVATEWQSEPQSEWQGVSA